MYIVTIVIIYTVAIMHKAQTHVSQEVHMTSCQVFEWPCFGFYLI